MQNQLDLSMEVPIPFSEVPALLPRKRGKKVHSSTVYRWATRGARGRVLESRLVGGVRYTTIAALNRFFDSTTVVLRRDRIAEALQRVLYDAPK